MTTEVLHIPEGINYECQGCGICCSGWAFPMTKPDYERISKVDWGELKPEYKGKILFKELNKKEAEGTSYTHRITSDDGVCPFLVNKLCFIHGQFGSDFKPQMCRQFPYAFTPTPSGVYATVSFVSMAVIYNQGPALTDQKETLEKMLVAFRDLYPQYQPDWSKIQLGVGQPISWDEYLTIEKELLSKLQDKRKPIFARLNDCCDYLAGVMQSKTGRAASGQASEASTKLNKLDRQLLSTFHKIYFPTKTARLSFKPFKYWMDVFLNASTVFDLPNKQVYALDQLLQMPFPEGDEQIEDIFYRYAYSIIFGKKYFGAGFGHLSIITGFHHLVLILVLAKLHAKGVAKARQAPTVSLIDVVASIRQLETQIGETTFTSNSVSTLELLLQSPMRAKRFLALV